MAKATTKAPKTGRPKITSERAKRVTVYIDEDYLRAARKVVPDLGSGQSLSTFVEGLLKADPRVASVYRQQRKAS